MNKMIRMAIGGLAMLGTMELNAQSCAESVMFKEGTIMEMQSFNAKDKLESTARHKITDVKREGDAVEATMNSEIMDNKGELIGNSSFSVKCENDIYYIDMSRMMDAAFSQSTEGMNITLEADNLDVPATGTPGQKLKDGKLTMTIQGAMMMVNTIEITNRQVEKTETITTPAGTYECIKITYDVNTKFVVKTTSRVEEWYAPGVGMILSKTYDKKGNLQSYTQLSKLN